MAGIPAGYRIRPATMGDVAAATHLINTCEVDESGESDYDPGEVAEDWGLVDIASDLILVESESSELIGIMKISSKAGEVTLDGYVHPNHERLGIGRFLVDRGGHQAEVHARRTPAGEQVVLLCHTDQGNQRATDLMDLTGFEPARSFLRMDIRLEEPVPSPVWPTGIELRPALRGRDELGLLETVDDAFSDNWNSSERTVENWLEQLGTIYTKPELWVQAFDGDRRVAVAIGREYPLVAWISQLGVVKDYRGRGLGLAILQEMFVRFAADGVRRVQLGVDAENTTGATRLYERAGMKVIRTHITWQKTLREATVNAFC